MLTHILQPGTHSPKQEGGFSPGPPRRAPKINDAKTLRRRARFTPQQAEDSLPDWATTPQHHPRLSKVIIDTHFGTPQRPSSCLVLTQMRHPVAANSPPCPQKRRRKNPQAARQVHPTASRRLLSRLDDNPPTSCAAVKGNQRYHFGTPQRPSSCLVLTPMRHPGAANSPANSPPNPSPPIRQNCLCLRHQPSRRSLATGCEHRIPAQPPSSGQDFTILRENPDSKSASVAEHDLARAETALAWTGFRPEGGSLPRRLLFRSRQR